MDTVGAKYDPAMKITDQAEADAYFERCVEHKVRLSGRTRREAEQIERSNLGYYAGYYDAETRARVERLFRCAHPVFGPIAENGSPSPLEAFQAGVRLARKTWPSENRGHATPQRPAREQEAGAARQKRWRRRGDARAGAGAKRSS